MATLRDLKTEAKSAATWRGHHMKRFETVNGHAATSVCRWCSMGIYVDAKPAPNGIDIGGEAVALNCEG